MQNWREMQTTDLLAYVKDNLRAVGPKAWPAIANETEKPLSLLRKIAYGNRRNPRLDTLQPLVNWFAKNGKPQ